MGKGHRKGWKKQGQNRSNTHSTKQEPAPSTKQEPITNGDSSSAQPAKKDVLILLKWCRGISAASILLGGVGFMQTPFFWAGTSLVYLGLILVATDLSLEPQVHRKFKITGVAVVVVLVILFSWFFVFVPAPLGVGATATPDEFPTGTTIGGIQWRPFYTELSLLINNPTDSAYDDVDLLLQPDYPVAAVAQVSNLSDVSFQDRYAFDLRMSLDESVLPLVYLATNAGYKVHCGHIPAQSALRIVMAIVQFKPGMFNHPKPTTLLSEIPNPMLNSYVARTRMTEGTDEFFYWWSRAGNETVYDKRPIPTLVKVSGHYNAGNRRRTINVQVAVSH